MVSALNSRIQNVFQGKAANDSGQKQLVIFTSDSLVAHMHLRDLMPFLKQNNIKPVVFFMPDTKSPRAAIPSLKRYDFYEAGILNNVIYPALEANEGRAQKLTPTFNQLARQYNFTPIVVESQKDPAIRAAVSAPNNIGAISIYHDTIFKADLIDAVKENGFFWNLHPAVLPQNQGLYLAFWNLMRGNTEHGCTLHEIDEGIDTGCIIGTSRGQLDPDKPVVGQYFDFTKGGSHLIKTALTDYLRQGTVTCKPRAQQAEMGYFTFPTEDDISKAYKQGVRMIGTPEEMVEIYTEIFGNENLLRGKILKAIAQYEGIQLPSFAAIQHQMEKAACQQDERYEQVPQRARARARILGIR